MDYTSLFWNLPDLTGPKFEKCDRRTDTDTQTHRHTDAETNRHTDTEGALIVNEIRMEDKTDSNEIWVPKRKKGNRNETREKQ